MKKGKKRDIQNMTDQQLMNRYNYLQSKPNTQDSRHAKYVLHHLRKRGLK